MTKLEMERAALKEHQEKKLAALHRLNQAREDVEMWERAILYDMQRIERLIERMNKEIV